MYRNLKALLIFLISLLEKHFIKKIIKGNNNIHDSINKLEIAIKKKSKDEIFDIKNNKITRDKINNLKNSNYYNYITREYIIYHDKDNNNKINI